MNIRPDQIRDFKATAIPDNLLELAIEWVGDNLYPEAVFSEEVLAEWAEDWAADNGYIKADPS